MLQDYTIKFQFLVIDTSPQGLNPLIYKVSNEGFRTKQKMDLKLNQGIITKD
jgi:hypothetical protein